MKKLLWIILTTMIGVFGFAAVVAPIQNANAQLQIQNQFQNPQEADNSENLSVVGAGSGQQDAFVNVIKSAINWILGILALIALIILLYWGFQMVTAAGNEDQYNKWFTILKQAAFGLIMVGIAWFIVSIIFWLVSLVTNQSAGTTAGTGA